VQTAKWNAEKPPFASNARHEEPDDKITNWACNKRSKNRGDQPTASRVQDNSRGKQDN